MQTADTDEKRVLKDNWVTLEEALDIIKAHVGPNREVTPRQLSRVVEEGLARSQVFGKRRIFWREHVEIIAKAFYPTSAYPQKLRFSSNYARDLLRTKGFLAEDQDRFEEEAADPA